jgi:mRNA interferase MazF
VFVAPCVIFIRAGGPEVMQQGSMATTRMVTNHVAAIAPTMQASSTMRMKKRGSIVTVAVQGDFGKARPALVVQSDLFSNHPTVTVLLMTTTLTEAPLLRIEIEPTPENGLNEPSQISVDEVFTVRREKIGSVIGEVDDSTMVAVGRSMVVFLGLA